MFLPDSKTVLLQGKARYNEEIHCCKWSNNLPTIKVLKAKLKSREKMERSNSIVKDKLKDHEDRWLKLL
jgi:hypothetical protein